MKELVNQTVESVQKIASRINVFTVGFVTLLSYGLVTALSIDHAAILADLKVVPPPLEASVSLYQFCFAFTGTIIALHVYLLLNLSALKQQVDFLIERLGALPNYCGLGANILSQPIVWALLPPKRGQIKRYYVARAYYIVVYAVLPVFCLLVIQFRMLPSQREVLLSTILAAVFLDLMALAFGLPWGFCNSKKKAVNGRHFASRRTVMAILFLALAALNVAVVFDRLGASCEQEAMFPSRLKVTSLELDQSGPLSLRNRNLRCGIFVGLDLSRADFRGADLRGANFTSTLLRGAIFLPPNVSLRQWEALNERQRRAMVDQLQAEFCTDASKTKAQCLDRWRDRITLLNDADLSNTDMTEATMGLAVLQGANLSGAELYDADLRGAMMQEAILNHVNASTVSVSETGVDDRATKLSSALLHGVQARGANFTGAHLQEIIAIGADFLDTDLKAAKLANSDFTAAVLVDAEAQEADFTGAYLLGTDLRGAKLEGAKGLVLQKLVATHVDLSRVVLSGGVLDRPHSVDLRSAHQETIADEADHALIILPAHHYNADQDVIVIDPISDRILVSPEGWPDQGATMPPEKVYGDIFHGLERELKGRLGKVTDYHYLANALREIACGDRVPRNHELENVLVERWNFLGLEALDCGTATSLTIKPAAQSQQTTTF